MRLDDLQYGDRFQIPGIGRAGVLLSLSPGCARVKYDNDARDVEITDDDGNVAKRFVSSGRPVTVSRGTEVERGWRETLRRNRSGFSD